MVSYGRATSSAVVCALKVSLLCALGGISAVGLNAQPVFAQAADASASIGATGSTTVGVDNEAPPPVDLSATAAATPAAAAPATTAAAAPAATDAAAAPAAEAAPEPPLAWDILHRRYNTWGGGTGGLFLLDPSMGEVGAVRIQLGFDTFSGDDFLLRNDHVEQDGQSLSVSWTATKLFELYGLLHNSSAATSKNPTLAGTQGPVSLSSQGDMLVGGKVGGQLGKIVYLGGNLYAALANQIGGGGATLGGTSLGLGAQLGLHFEQLEHPVPLIVRFNAGYLFDNSAQVVKDTEDHRYRDLNGAKASQDDETRHLVNRFERFAMNINRVDRMDLGLGLEVPLEVAERFFLHPLAELRLGVPVNRQDFDCPFVSSDKQSGSKKTAQDSCYERTSGSAFPMSLALGIRAVPPVRGVSATLGVDIGLVGTSHFVRDLAPIAPYRVLFAVSYDYDARPIEVPPPPPAPVVVPPPPSGRLQGSVMSSDGSPVAGAIVAFVDHDATAVATSSDGHFLSEAFAPGEVHLEVHHPDFDDGQCAAIIPATGGNVEARCMIDPKPRTGSVNGHVIDAYGTPVVAAQLQLTGAQTLSMTSDVRGNFELQNMNPGEYIVRVQAPGYFVRLSKLNVETRHVTPAELTLMQKPAKPTVLLKGQNIDAKAIKFTGSSTELDAAGAQAAAELADLLLTRTDLNIRIQGYGDDTVALSRALLVKQRLVDAGVPDARVEAIGGGKNKLVISVVP